ncbi:MAG: hypothetical protein E7263_04175 [Lachnospiraceae bacterium]|nr:hypothetical protein [Lachnospiraceae bacterium]
MKKTNLETNIDLNLDMDTGIPDGKKEKLTLEDMEIMKSRGRSVTNKEESDAEVAAIANFRVMGYNQ